MITATAVTNPSVPYLDAIARPLGEKRIELKLMFMLCAVHEMRLDAR